MRIHVIPSREIYLVMNARWVALKPGELYVLSSHVVGSPWYQSFLGCGSVIF